MLRTGWLCLLATIVVALSLSPSLSASASSEDAASSLADTISSRDQARLRQLFRTAEPYSDLADAFHIVSGLSVLGFQDSDMTVRDNACKYALTSVDKSSLESVFYATSTIKILEKSCIGKITGVEDLLRDAVEKEDSSTESLFFAVTAMSNLGMKISNSTVLLALMKAVEREEAPLSHGQAYLAASLLPDGDLSELFDQIEDTVAQADETADTLYFEEGLKVTSTILTGIFALADRVNDAPAITGLQVTKFANYIVSSKYASSVTDAYYLLSAANALSTNKFVVPSALLLADRRLISSSNPTLKVSLSTLLGEALSGFSVHVLSIEDPSGELVEKNSAMTPAENGLYTYNIYPDTSGPGKYTVTLSTETKSGSPVVALPSIKVSLTVSFQMTIGSAKLAIVDKEQGVTTKSTSLEFPKQTGEKLEADSHSKLVMTFTMLNKATSNKVTVHQAFVRLTLNSQEIFFVATANSDMEYSFELDIAESASDFDNEAGTYAMTLIVGDFSLENSFSWDVGSVVLKFPGTPTEKPAADMYMYKPKPEIKHMFRIPEKRPPEIVSTAFTFLVLAPLAILIILWALLGANISSIGNGGIWAILFHLGLTAIFALYYCFWTQLDMFQTLKYLAGVGLFTFLAGNRMLRRIAQARQA